MNLLITIFSDASVSDGIAGAGFWHKSSECSGHGSVSIGRKNITAHEAELWGLLSAVKHVFELGIYQKRDVDLLLQCDSMAALSAIASRGNGRWAKTSKLKGSRRALTPWEGELLKELRGLPFKKLWLKHVKGHNGTGCARSFINTKNDAAAKAARLNHTSP